LKDRKTVISIGVNGDNPKNENLSIDDLVLALGSLVLNFASLEETLSMAIWLLIDCSDDAIGKIVTAGMPFNGQIEVFEALYRHRLVGLFEELATESEADVDGKSALELEEHLAELVKRMRTANEQRNGAIHSAWAVQAQEASSYLKYKFTTKGSKGVRRTETKITADDLWELSDRIVEIRDELGGLSVQLWQTPSLWLQHLSRWREKWNEWKEAGLIKRTPFDIDA
jgi:hypothetical protein